MGKKNHTSSEDVPSYLAEGESEGEECLVCKQEFQGACPLNKADCPCVEEEEDEKDVEDEEEEDEDPDFDDVENLKEVLKDDEEADRLTEEEEKIDKDAGKKKR